MEKKNGGPPLAPWGPYIRFFLKRRRGLARLLKLYKVFILTKKFQIPLRTLQRPQPVFNPNSLCVQAFCCYEGMHFAWAIHTYVEASGSNTLHGSGVQLQSQSGIRSVYTCTVWHFIFTHWWCTPCAWITSTAVHLYFSPVSLSL